MPVTIFSSALWVEWSFRFDNPPNPGEVIAKKALVEARVNQIVNFYNGQPNTHPTNLSAAFVWTENPLDQLTLEVKVYLKGEPNRPGGGPGQDSIKTPPPPPPPPPL